MKDLGEHRKAVKAAVRPKSYESMSTIGCTDPSTRIGKTKTVDADPLFDNDPWAIATYAATYAATAAPVHPVIEYIAPVPTVTYVVPSQQLPPVHNTTTDTFDDNLDMTSLVYTQFSNTAVDPFAPHVVDSFPPLEKFTEPVYSPVHQEQIAVGEPTKNTAEIPVVQEQLIVQEILYVVAPLPAVEEFTEPVYNPVHQEQIVAGEVTQTIIKNSDVQEQVIVQEIPEVVDSAADKAVSLDDLRRILREVNADICANRLWRPGEHS